MAKQQDITLQEMLERAGIKQRDIADLLGLHESTVSLKVSGKREMSIKEAGVIADSLKTTIDQILYALNFAKCKQTDQATLCCNNPAKPTAAPGNECKVSSCCGLCQNKDCNVRQPCRREGLSKTG